jgi:hypothetical protein
VSEQTRLKNRTNDHGYSEGIGFFGRMQGFAGNDETAGEVAEPPNGSSGPYVGALRAASLAGKPRLQIGQADGIRKSVAADRGPMGATIVRAVDQKAAHPGGAHFGEGDFLRASSDALIGRYIRDGKAD